MHTLSTTNPSTTINKLTANKNEVLEMNSNNARKSATTTNYVDMTTAQLEKAERRLLKKLNACTDRDARATLNEELGLVLDELADCPFDNEVFDVHADRFFANFGR